MTQTLRTAALSAAGFVAVLAMAACSKKEQPEEPQEEPQDEYGETYYASRASLSSTDENFHHTTDGYALWFSAEGGSATINVTCGCEWTAEASYDGDETGASETAEWLTLTPSDDGSSITVTAEAMETSGDETEASADGTGGDDSARTATITFKTLEEGVEFCPVDVTQSDEEPEYEDAPAITLTSDDASFALTDDGYTLTLSCDGGSAEILVDCDCEWTLTTDDDWLTLEPADDGSSLTVSAAIYGTARTETITFTSASDETELCTLTVTQLAYEGEDIFLLWDENGDDMAFATEWSSDYYDLTSILSRYNPSTVAYIAYEVGKTYNLTFKYATEEEVWFYNYKAYTYEGTLFASSSDDKAKYHLGTSSDENGSAYITLTLDEDPGDLFYLLFTHGEGYDIVFFTTEQESTNEIADFVILKDNVQIDYETEFSSDYYDLGDLLDQYSPVRTAYLKYEVGVEYNITIDPSNGDWTQSPVDKDFAGNWLDAWPKYYDQGYTTFTLNGADHYGYRLELLKDPKTLFYLVFQETDDDTGAITNYILFFYSDGEPGSYTEYDYFEIKNASNYVTTAASSEDPGLYTDAMNAIIDQYSPEVVNYFEYELNAQYIVTMYPYSTANTFISNGTAYAKGGSSLTAGRFSNYFSVSFGTDFTYGGVSYPSMSFTNLQEHSAEFCYLLCQDDEGTYCLLFLYLAVTQDDETEYTGFLVRDEDTKDEIEVTSSYIGDGSYDFSSIISDYGATNVGYAEMETGTTYDIQPTPAQKNAEQVWDAGVYTLSGSDCSGNSNFTITRNTSISSDGFSYPAIKITVAEEPAEPFYVVFDKGYANKSIIFLTAKAPEDTDDYDATKDFVVQNTEELTYYTVQDASQSSFRSKTGYTTSSYQGLAETLAETYTDADIAFILYNSEDTAIFYANVASLPLSEAANWSVSELTDAEGDPASWSSFSYSTTTFHDSAAFSVKVNPGAGLPVYMVFTNSVTSATKILIFSK